MSMRVFKLDMGVFIDRDCRGIVAIDYPGYYIPAKIYTSWEEEEYQNDLAAFLQKWYSTDVIDPLATRKAKNDPKVLD